MVYNIPAIVTSLPTDSGSFFADQLPEGAVCGLNDVGVKDYVEPCPFAGELHRYVITVYALNDKIAVGENASSAFTGFMLHMNTIAKASLLVCGKNAS